MRIATRLWLALVGSIVVVLGAGVLVRAREEQRLLLDVTLRDRQFFAHALHAAISEEHQPRDPLAQARSMLDRREVAAAHIVARLVAVDGDRGLPPPVLRGETIAPLARGEVVVGVHDDEILTYVPVEWGSRTIAIELAEPQALRALLQRIGWWSLGAQALALAALVALISFALIGLFVGRPLHNLNQLARQIASGALDARVALPRSGEVAVLAGEMNAMAAQLQTTQRALEDANAERVSALEQLRHADRLRTVGQLASALAHELGTPLNVVVGYARMIEEDPEATPELRQNAEQIVEQGHRMTMVVRQLLDFARRPLGQPTEHDLGALAELAVHTLHPVLRREAVAVSVDAPEPVIVEVVAQSILQVLTNLVMNAVDASEPGGEVTIEVRALDAVPPVGEPLKPGRYAQLAVIDHGAGIDPADVEYLFEPFFTRKREGEGTGLGLAVVQGIVRDHRGWVGVSSVPGRGSRFEVFLPLTSAIATPDA